MQNLLHIQPTFNIFNSFYKQIVNFYEFMEHV